jgi:mono/diheme cytochrome c family protein
MSRRLLFALLFLITLPAAADTPDASLVERGRYLARIAGCHDCHSPGFANSGGKTPPEQWFTGDRLGFAGPWGTTYPSNLRRAIGAQTLPAWKAYARVAVLRPPMPYWALNAMTDADLEALWHYTRSLGPAGEPAPAALPPGAEAPPPVFRLVLPAAATP